MLIKGKERILEKQLWNKLIVEIHSLCLLESNGKELKPYSNPIWHPLNNKIHNNVVNIMFLIDKKNEKAL